MPKRCVRIVLRAMADAELCPGIPSSTVLEAKELPHFVPDHVGAVVVGSRHV